MLEDGRTYNQVTGRMARHRREKWRTKRAVLQKKIETKIKSEAGRSEQSLSRKRSVRATKMKVIIPANPTGETNFGHGLPFSGGEKWKAEQGVESLHTTFCTSIQKFPDRPWSKMGRPGLGKGQGQVLA